MVDRVLCRHVRDFVESLIEKRKRKSPRHLRQNWASALEDYREQFTSLELEKKSLDWRGEYESTY